MVCRYPALSYIGSELEKQRHTINNWTAVGFGYGHNNMKNTLDTKAKATMTFLGYKIKESSGEIEKNILRY